ncbi:hypothetical protein [Hyalangium rubrum]|uniref:Lipoprotein n=1 Tax=Hyalangium rubrum TaxID=3103134 RepID=A0ABU5H3U4_9BACT|nr:hypothetical protein [Hyalangium sp. s54d21]MDY7227797.1 hypothetical protein [Hyalangium sp. s54d21]
MRPARALLFLVALLGLPGCSEECLDCDVECVAPQPTVLLNMPGILMAGQPATLSLPPAHLGGCGSGSQASSATSEVYGPDGALVPSELTFSGPTASTRLRFTPPQPGPYHLLIAFAPVGGLQQFDLHAAADRSAEATRLTLPSTCTSLERTRLGTWACGSTLIRDGMVVAQFEGARLAVADDVVWVVTETLARRFHETPTEFWQSHSVGYTSRSTEFLLATPDELLLLHGSELMQIVARSGLRSPSTVVPLPAATVGPRASRGVLLRDGEHVALVSRAETATGTDLQVCPILLAPSGPARLPTQCQLISGHVVGFEPSVLWTADPPTRLSGGGIHRWTWTAGRLQEQSALALGSQIRLVETTLLRPTAVPVVSSVPSDTPPAPFPAVVTWSAERQRLSLEHLDSTLLELSASPSFYWGRGAPPASGSQTQLLLRPSSP